MIVWDQHQGCSIELTRFHDPNVVSYKVVINKRTPLSRSYLPPSTLEHLLNLLEDIKIYRNHNIIVLGDLNTDIKAQNPDSQQVAEMLRKFGLVDLRHHLDSAGGSDIGNVVSYM